MTYNTALAMVAEAITGSVPVTIIFSVLGTGGAVTLGFCVKILRGLWKDLRPRLLSIMDEHIGLLKDTRKAVDEMKESVAQVGYEHKKTRDQLDTYARVQERLLEHLEACPLRKMKMTPDEDEAAR